MNPQPDPIVGNVVAIIFVLLIVFYTIQAINQNKTIQISDNFVIGYLVDEPVTSVEPIKTATQKHHNTRKPKVVKTAIKQSPTTTTTTTTTTPAPIIVTTTPRPLNNEETRLYSDCIEAMVSLGMKKTYSRQLTKEVFQKHHINNIQEFIMIAMKMVHNQ